MLSLSLFVAFMALSIVLYRLTSFMNMQYLPVVFKCLASLSFTLTGIVQYKNNKNHSKIERHVARLILVGLVLSLCADVTIYFNFMAGFAVFLVVQTIYLFAYGNMIKKEPKFFIYSLVFTVLIAISLFAYPFIKLGSLLIPVMIYLCIISFVTISAIFGLNNKTIGSKFVALGAVMFFVSDYVLMFTVSGVSFLPDSLKFIFHSLNSLLYFPAQMFTACALRHPLLKSREIESINAASDLNSDVIGY